MGSTDIDNIGKDVDNSDNNDVVQDNINDGNFEGDGLGSTNINNIDGDAFTEKKSKINNVIDTKLEPNSLPGSKIEISKIDSNAFKFIWHH